MAEPPVYLETALSLTLEQRIALEQESEAEASRPTLNDKVPPLPGCVFS